MLKKTKEMRSWVKKHENIKSKRMMNQRVDITTVVNFVIF